MLIGLLVANTLPDSLGFRHCDRIAVHSSTISLPDDARFFRLSDTPLSDDFELFDDWATQTANTLRRDGELLPIREREYFRITIQEFLQDRLGNSWGAVIRFLSSLTNSPTSSIILMVEDRFLQSCIEAWCVANGIGYAVAPVASFNSGSKVPNAGGGPTMLAKLAEGWRASLNRWSGICRLRCNRSRKLLYAYIGHQDDYEFFDYTLREMQQRGYEVVLVDVRRWKGERMIHNSPYPYVHLWSLPLVLGIGATRRLVVPEIQRDCITHLPLANDYALQALAVIITCMADFQPRWQKAHSSLWQHRKPHAILAMSEGADMACMAHAAARHRIATVDLAHALQPAKSRSYAFDALALFGPDNVATHNRRETPPSFCDIVALGSCRYDKIYQGDYPDAKFIRTQLGLAEDRPIVVFVSQYLWKGDARIAELKSKIAQWLQTALPHGAILILKKHPLEDDSICEDILRDALGERFKVTRQSNIYALLNIASAVVVMWSNTGLEAVLMDKPVIAVPGEGVCPLPYMTYGLCQFAHSADELRAHLIYALKAGIGFIPDYAQKKKLFIADILTAHDGNSHRRLADLLEKKIQQIEVIENGWPPTNISKIIKHSPCSATTDE